MVGLMERWMMDGWIDVDMCVNHVLLVEDMQGAHTYSFLVL